MHCLRLYFECIELMREGTITLPRPEKDLLIGVRRGEWTLERFRAEAAALHLEAERAAAESALPDRVDTAAISELIASVHLEYWGCSSAIGSSGCVAGSANASASSE